MFVSKPFLAGAALALTALPAAASYSTFFGEDLNNSSSVRLASTPNANAASASFLGSLVGVGTETFESFAAGAMPPLPLSFPGAGSATLAGDGTITNVPSGTNGFGRYPISGSKYLDVSSNGTFTITFAAAGGVAAFGFYGVDIADFGDPLIVTLTKAAGGTQVFNIPSTLGSNGSTDGSVLFWGVIGSSAADKFTSATFASGAGASEVFAFDNMTIGALEQVCGRPGGPACATPEPGSLALVTIGLTVAGFGMRRRSNRSQRQ